RNTALERENEALRRELAERAEPRDAVPPPPGRARRIAGALGRGLRACGRAVAARKVWLVMTTIPALVGAGIIALSRCDAVSRIARGEPYLGRVMIVPAEDGPVVAV